MTSPANETSELTAYALGELQAHQATDIHRLFTDCPAATSELEQIEAVTDALRQFAPIPQERLNPEQRHAVLRPVNMPRRMAPMQPRVVAKKPTAFWPVMRTMLKAAAVVTVTGAAYWMGRQTDLGSSSAATVATSEKEPVTVIAPEISAPEKPEVMVVQAPQPKEAPLVVKTTPQPAPVVAAVKPAPAPAPTPAPAPEKVQVVAAQAPEAVKPAAKLPEAPKVETLVTPAPKVAPVLVATITRQNAELGFVSTGKQEVDQVAIRPSNFRPAPTKPNPKDTVLAAPLPVQPPKLSGDTKPRTASEVYLHAWRTDVTSCPWNPATRLLCVTLQIPPNQPAADSVSSFPLQVSFDRRYVREFRRLCERHTAATEMNTSGKQTVWYEFQPVSDEAVRTGRPVATITLDKGRFTTPNVAPFDGSKLAVLDRGTAWSSGREEFLFESAVVGFGMLLRGDHNSPALSHEVVLSLAEKGKGSDASGERGKFIREVNDARRAAGL